MLRTYGYSVPAFWALIVGAIIMGWLGWRRKTGIAATPLGPDSAPDGIAPAAPEKKR